MKLIIAEKPDQGATLAKPFPHKKNQGFLEILPNDLFPNGAYVTWAVGHLLQLKSPEKYSTEWKKWTKSTLPIIPSQFQYEVTSSKYKQFQKVKELLLNHKVTEIIHAGDAGREGELIIRNIIHQSGVKKPMKRLWISSLTKNAIVEGFQSLLNEEDTRNLYYEAYSRACADWIVGMNASRIYSILLKEKGIHDVFSAGRVQTPTLALIVKRENEIENFVSKPFWEVLGKFQMNGEVYEGTWEKDGESRLDSREMAERIASFCHTKTAEVGDVEKERKEYQSPLLFNLSNLQSTANSLYKMSPKHVLDIAQSLYQKGIISYPRSDSTVVTKGEAEAFPAILKKLSKLEAFSSYFPLPKETITSDKRFVNDKKVTDHYAIIPTEQVTDLTKLSNDEQKIYSLIVKRLIAAYYPPHIVDYTRIVTVVDNRATFVTKGKVKIQEGWKNVINIKKDEKDIVLPELHKGMNGNVHSTTIREGKTQPPKRYTEGQLISLMKTAGKTIEDSKLEKILKDTEGLGTEATRAGIITMLKTRNYINVTKNQVYATDKAKILIYSIGDKILASPEMTAKWETRLKEIGQGSADAGVFMEQVKKLTGKIVEDAKEISTSWNFDQFDIESVQGSKQKFSKGKSIGSCLICEGKVIDKGSFYGCSEYSKSQCAFTISKKILGKTVSQAQIKKILKDKESDRITGFKKKDKTFDARLKWNSQTKKIEFSFEK